MNYMEVSVYGEGCLGQNYTTSDRKTKCFQTWQNMMKRCYSTRESAMAKAYVECTVSDHFKNFSNFKNWWLGQGTHEVGWQLDKDLITKGNRVYSEENCCYLPKEINMALVRRTKYRGDYVIGVGYKPLRKQYRARHNVLGKNVHLGWFATELDAFFAYKKAKEAHLKELAEKWKDRIDPRAYEALMNYQVEVTD